MAVALIFMFYNTVSLQKALVVLGLCGVLGISLVVYAETKPGGDTDPPEPVSVCGDKICSADETTLSCPADCPNTYPPGTTTCGDKICSAGETSASCPADCGQTDPPETSWECGNGVCETGETHSSCSIDCPATGGGGGNGGGDDDGGSTSGGGGFSNDYLIIAILKKLIEVLQELIALLISQRA